MKPASLRDTYLCSCKGTDCISGWMKAVLTGMPHNVIGEVFLSCKGLAAKFASERSIVSVRPHMAH